MKLAAAAAAAIWIAGAGLALAEAPLVDAARTSNATAVDALLTKGADVKSRDAEGATALLWAAHNENVGLVKKLLAAGADPQAANDYGATPMSEAAFTGNAEILGLLIDAGVPVDAKGADGQTPLMVVARSGKLEAAKLLIAKGAKVDNREGWDGQTALMWATAQKHPDMVALLIEHGADVNARSTIHDWEHRITAEPRPKDMLRGGLTPLLFAARDNCMDCAKVLLQHGAKVDMPDPDGETPLLIALMNVHFEMAKFLINSGADLDRWDIYGRSPVYEAVDMDILPETGRSDLPSDEKTTGLDVAQMLLDKGANPNIQLMVRPPYRSVTQDRGGDNLLNTGATPLLLAAKAGNAKAVALLVKYKALLELPTANGVTPLQAAAFMGHAPTNNNPTRGRYKTEDQGVECVRILAEAGANVNARNPDGQTAVHIAAQLGYNKIVQVLADHGADLMVADAKGHTALDYATGFPDPPGPAPAPGHKETVALLQKLTASKTATGPKTAVGPKTAAPKPVAANTTPAAPTVR